MKNYPFSFETLSHFSNTIPYTSFSKEQKALFIHLNKLKSKYNFPSIENDIGSFLSFLINLNKSKIIFEMGSGFGQSCFWYSLEHSNIEKIFLTEKRDDLEKEFHACPWENQFKDKISYLNQDAFDVIKYVYNIDFLLIDGVKADYKKFLEHAYDHLNQNAIIAIDNSYWRGSFLDEEYLDKKSAKNIKELHEFIAQDKRFQSVFMPYKDGLSLLRKLPS